MKETVHSWTAFTQVLLLCKSQSVARLSSMLNFVQQFWKVRPMRKHDLLQNVSITIKSSYWNKFKLILDQTFRLCRPFDTQFIWRGVGWRHVCVQGLSCYTPTHCGRNLIRHPPSAAELSADFEQSFPDGRPWFLKSLNHSRRHRMYLKK